MSLPLPKPAAFQGTPYNGAPVIPLEYALADGVIVPAVADSYFNLFHPLKVKYMVLPDRIGVLPMWKHLTEQCEVTDYQSIHYGGFSGRGPGLIVVEDTAVAPNAGTSLVDLGIWKDSQAEKFRPIVQYAHTNMARIGLQLAHAGSKSKKSVIYEHLENCNPRDNKNEFGVPSTITISSRDSFCSPSVFTIDEIHTLVQQFGSAARRAVTVGFDFVEIHAADGYLINEFMSSHTNKRTDEYGGSFENRIRLLLEVIDSVRANIPEDFPVFLRWSGNELYDYNPDAWSLAESVKLAPIVVERGVDFLDIYAGGRNSGADITDGGFEMFVEFARKIKDAVGHKATVSSVGGKHDPVKINELIEAGEIDFALVGTHFKSNQGLVIDWADTMSVEVYNEVPCWALRPKNAEMFQYINFETPYREDDPGSFSQEYTYN